MALSRLAKKLRELEPDQNSDANSSKKNKKNKKAPAGHGPAPTPAPAAQVVVAPAAPPEPVAPPEPPKPGKRQQEKVKRPKFVYVPEKTERKPLPEKKTVQAPPVTKLAARLLTQKLALPPDEEPARGPTLPGFGRL
ncbi:MAG: hypothetical protein U0804_08195 [Gemmataceae bacterium]